MDTYHPGQTGTFLQFQEAVIKALIFQKREREGPQYFWKLWIHIVPGQHFHDEVPKQQGREGPKKIRNTVCSKGGYQRTLLITVKLPEKSGLGIKNFFKVYHLSIMD